MNEQPKAKLNTRAAFLAGSLGGLLMTLVLVALRFIVDAEVITEVMADWLTSLLPIAVFDFFLDQLQFNAKRLLFVLIFIGQIGVGGLIGLAYARFSVDSGYEEGSVKRGAVLAVGIWLVLVLVVTPIMGKGFFGSGLIDGALTYSAPLLFAVGTYALTLSQVLALAGRSGGIRYNASRRDFLQKAAVFSAIALVGGFAIQTIVTNLARLTPVISGRRRGQLSTLVTPNEDFYVVAKSYVTPMIDAEKWTLELERPNDGGLVNLTYAELLAMPAIEEYVTLTCISNLVGGDLISNALWKGVPLRLVLERAGIGEGTERLAFRAADGYDDICPYDVAIRDEVIVAYEMNGEPLPISHGFPARIIVPGLYGMEHVKWLMKIAPVPADYRGYWQRRGWADTAIIKTMSRIDIPGDRAKIPIDEIEVAGVAFAGKRGIQRVEVSVDDGRSWRDARFEAPLSAFTWVIWRLDFPDPMPERIDIVVRATDGTGEVQTSRPTKNHPSGATGYHEIRVTLTEPAPTPTPTITTVSS